MRVGWILVGAALCAGGASALGRPGKAVRVEQTLHRFGAIPRLCTLSINDLHAYCIGLKPEIGDQLAVIDDHHRVGTVRVEKVDSIGSCKNRVASQWMVQTEPVGDIARDGEQVGAVIDIPIAPNGHMLAVDRSPPTRSTVGEQAIGIDTDGDGRVDVEFMLFLCDDQGTPSTSSSTGQCLEVWSETDGSFERLRADVIPQACS